MKHNSTATRAFDLVQKGQDIGVLSISVSAARTSRSSLIQHEDRTAGEMLPMVGNNIALPLYFHINQNLSFQECCWHQITLAQQAFAQGK